MLIDQTHRTWLIISALALAASTAIYTFYALSAVDGPQGGSVVGLWFGVSGTILMILAGMLSARKRFPRLRLGSAQFWLRGHIWLGLLSGPMILFHAGFQWGGLLEQVILVLTIVIIASGVVGLALQQLLPHAMAATIPAEAMFDQLPSVCESLRNSADRTVTDVCGAAALLSPQLQTDEPRAILASFYRETIRPFLGLNPTASPLAQATAATSLFQQVASRVPGEMQTCLDQLARLCDERRQLLTQARLHRWLHGWLLLHVPLSAALLVLGLAHAVTALWY